MKVSARLNLVFTGPPEDDLGRIAVLVARSGGDVRWRTDDEGNRELHVRLTADDHVYQLLTETAERYLDPYR
jgi:hypothetical protein